MATKKITAEEVQIEEINPNSPTEEVKPKRKAKVKAEEVTEEVEKITEEVEEAKQKKVEEIDPDELVKHKVSRFSQEVARASKKTKKDMYKSEHVVTEYGDEEIETDSTKLREDYLELVASATSKKILEGRLAGFRYAGETRKSTILAEIDYGTGLFTVLIPSYLIYDYEISKYVDPTKIQIIETNILRRMGSRVKFVVRNVNEKDRTAYADHLEAQQAIGYQKYIRLRRDGKPEIINDMIVKSQVLYTASRGIIVDALGCEIDIPKDELSHSYIGDARQEFRVGDDVNVRVTDIKTKEIVRNDCKYTLVQATGSVKSAIPDHRKEVYKQFKEDGVYSAEVTFVEENGIYAKLRGGIDILVALPRYGNMPKRGQSITVRITQKDDERLFIWGILIGA